MLVDSADDKEATEFCGLWQYSSYSLVPTDELRLLIGAINRR